MYKYVLNSVVKISMMFAKYFEYYTYIYTIILGGRFFMDTLYNLSSKQRTVLVSSHLFIPIHLLLRLLLKQTSIS